MCNRYNTPEETEIERFWRIDGRSSPGWIRQSVFPRAAGPFIRRTRDDPGYSRELVVGRWGLIPWFSKTPDIKYSTNNARSEELLDKASYRDPWRRGQRCIIPASDFDEPNWESGKNVWWRFTRADDAPWGLAGLWNTWVDPSSGEQVESYTMLTINADSHPLMSRMHKPDPKLPPDRQDKRSVVSIESADVDQWLEGTLVDAQRLLRLPSMELLVGQPLT